MTIDGKMPLMIGKVYVKTFESTFITWNIEIEIDNEKLVPDAYNDTTELSDNHTEAETKVLPAWMAGIELENEPKLFAIIADKEWPVVGITSLWDNFTIGTWKE